MPSRPFVEQKGSMMKIFRFVAIPAIIGLMILSLAPAWGQKSIYSYTGTNQSYVIPANVTSISVKLWGAGGACAGGSGAFISGLLSVTPGETLTLIVGGGNGVSYRLGERSYGGGGSWRGVSDVLAGGGGGCSVILLGNTQLAVVGAGGAGTYATNTGNFSLGGGGGILTGGTSGNGVTGGTQTSGGTSFDPYGVTGGSLSGGDALGRGAGGGSGYYGGGGGSQIGEKGLFGGGGGSSLIANLTGLIAEPGQLGSTGGVLPGGFGDIDYQLGIGVGGTGGIGSDGGNGGNGRIVITALAPVVVPEPGSLTLLLPIFGIAVSGYQKRRARSIK